ncbi:hypothetical protein [Nostoc sp. MS1]|uniref:hypothetical protein n=1 Tax=Nostoc sp. MS1 TaxID=2764711 RepID=UPI001CC69B3E|nr:hypothetical protein [Nostoc sp. MS1]
MVHQATFDQDKRMTSKEFIGRFDFYVSLDASGHTRFYPPFIEFGLNCGIRFLLSEIRSYGLIKCENEIDKLLLEQYIVARNGYNALTLADLRKKIESVFQQYQSF